jgi:transcriptional antiterminator RfaH
MRSLTSTDQPTVSAPAHGKPHWYLIQSRPRQALRAEENLTRQGYTTFQPRFLTQRVRRGRRVQVEAELFPNYLFIRLNRWSDNWYPVRSTRGVARMVTFGRDPLPVAEELIDAIRQRIAQRRIEPAYKPGEQVELIDGPFAGLNAVFAAERDEERVVLLIELLHRQLRVTAPISSIRRRL